MSVCMSNDLNNSDSNWRPWSIVYVLGSQTWEWAMALLSIGALKMVSIRDRVSVTTLCDLLIRKMSVVNYAMKESCRSYVSGRFSRRLLLKYIRMWFVIVVNYIMLSLKNIIAYNIINSKKFVVISWLFNLFINEFFGSKGKWLSGVVNALLKACSIEIAESFVKRRNGCKRRLRVHIMSRSPL